MKTVINFKNAINGDVESIKKDLNLSDEELEYNHHPGVHDDHTLCGLAYGEYIEDYSYGKITCPHCIHIITEMKKLKKGKDY